MRAPVRFAAAVGALRGAGVSTFAELGPGPVLCAMGAQCAGPGEDVAWIPVLAKGQDEPRSAVAALGGMWVRGVAVDWARWFPAWPGGDLPTYAFEHRRYWLAGSAGRGDPQHLGQAASGHPLLAAAVELPDGGLVLTGRLSLADHPWLADHVITGRAVLPGAALAELAVAAGDQAGCAMAEELILHTPLVIPATGALTLRVTITGPAGGGQRTADIFSRASHDATWTRNATAALTPDAAPAGFDLAAWPPPAAEPVDVAGFYDRLPQQSVQYGPAFRGLKAAWRRGQDVSPKSACPKGCPPAATGCTPPCSTPPCTHRPAAARRQRR